MSEKVRVRFAPSPTGPLHIGGVRTALFNYLFAKKNGGTFVLRIEDTDQTRYVSNAEAYIVESLNWLGIPFEEGPGKDGGFGPYRQSERKEIYKQYADELIEKGFAYYAFDTPESLEKHREDHQNKGKTFIYNWHNRNKLDNSLNLSEEIVNERIAEGVPYVIRFKSPQDEILVMHDLIRGEINVDTNTLDDKVLFKSDGMPTYHLANIVDDHLMEITHVIRGEEWLPSMPLHILLYRSFGWKAPEFAHLPLILKPTGQGKLSKRDGDKHGFPVFPLLYTNPDSGEVSRGYREDGYFKEAVVNMLALLGWNPGTEQEIFSLEELVEAFDIGRVNKSGAKFDPEKTKWFQQQYFKNTSSEEIASLFLPILQKQEIEISLDKLKTIIDLIKERAVFVRDLSELSNYFFHSPEVYDQKTVEKVWKEDSGKVLAEVAYLVESVEEFKAANIEKTVKDWIQAEGIGFGKVMQPLRLALVGELKGADLFILSELIGKQETLSRITNAVERLG